MAKIYEEVFKEKDLPLPFCRIEKNVPENDAQYWEPQGENPIAEIGIVSLHRRLDSPSESNIEQYKKNKSNNSHDNLLSFCKYNTINIIIVVFPLAKIHI